MKILIILCVISGLIFFTKVEYVETIEEYNTLFIMKLISLIVMILTFISIIIKW